MDNFNLSKKEIIERIGYFRNKQGISARELSLRIGKHEGYINKLESLDFNLPSKMLLDIIEALDITPAEFFSENYTDYRINNELLKLIEELPYDKKVSMIDFLKK